MAVIIPMPIRHDEVAKNQHMIPRCYMKSWAYNKKKTSVWVYDKETNYNSNAPQTSVWSIESKSTTNINALYYFHDLKAGFVYLPQEALVEIFTPILKFKVFLNGEILDTEEKLNSKYHEFDNWEIFDSNGVKFTQEEKGALHDYLKESRYTFVETEWAHTYENDWGSFLAKLECDIRNIRTLKDIGSSNIPSISFEQIEKTVRYCVIYNWRSIEGNERFNTVFDAATQILQGIAIPENERIYESDVTAAEEFKHNKRIKDFIEFLKNDSGLLKDCINGYLQNTVPYFMLTDSSHPFITSNEPSFTYTREDGLLETVFVASPTMLIRFGRGDKGSYYVVNATSNDVDEMNKVIAKRGNLLILPSQSFDISLLLS